MAAKKKVAEIPVPSLPARTFMMILSGAIHTGKNIRRHFDDEAHNALVESVRVNGILEPLIVMHSDKSGEFTLVAGERRYRAAVALQLPEVPCFVYPPLTDMELYDIMISENLHRSELNPIEEAEGIQKLLDAGMTQENLGKKISKSQEYISNRLRLLTAPEELKEMVISREITPSHVFSILSFSEYPIYDLFIKNFKTTNDKYKEDQNGQGFTVKNISDGLAFKFFAENQKNTVLKKVAPSLRPVSEVWDIYKEKCYGCKTKFGNHYDGNCLNLECYNAMIIRVDEFKKEKEKDVSNSVEISRHVPKSYCENCDNYSVEKSRSVCLNKKAYKLCFEECLLIVEKETNEFKSKIMKEIFDQISMMDDKKILKIVLNCLFDTISWRFEDSSENKDYRYIVSGSKKPFEEMTMEELIKIVVLYDLSVDCFSSNFVDVSSIGNVFERLKKWGLEPSEEFAALCPVCLQEDGSG